MISLKNVSFSYDGFEEGERKRVLKDINLEINSGEFIAILGHNGSGKSTLAKTLNGICVPDEGSVLVDGTDTKDLLKWTDVKKKVGMVFQNPDNQIVATIVEEDVAFGPENLGVEPKEIRKRVDEALKTVNMVAFSNHSPHLLSGGQKQRVAIAGVIAMEPEYIVFDESTAMLDPIGRSEVMNTISNLNKKGIAVILITHYMEEAALADRVIVMHEGEIKMDAPPREVFSQWEKMEELNLGVPQATRLYFELNKYGVNFEEIPLNTQEFLEQFRKIKGKINEN